MKILIVSQYFWPESFSVNAIASYLASQNHQVDVITGIPNYPAGEFYEGYGCFKKNRETYNGVNILRVPIKARGKKGGDKRLILNYLTYAASASVAAMGRLGKKYDVIFVYAMSPITQAYPALLLRAFKKIPVCLYVGDLWPDTLFSHGINGGTVKKLVTKACESIYKKSDSIVIVNESFRTPVEKYSNRKHNITFIPQAVECLYKPVSPNGELRKKLSIPEKAFVIMFAGNLGYAQSVLTITNAANLLANEKDIHFVFVGDGTLKSECEQFCKENGLGNCHFIGRRSQEEMPQLIAEADAMLVTLKNQSNYNLTLPGRTQAFMACGKPIICCANGETARIIKESGAGLACQAENPEELAKAILSLRDLNTQERAKIGNNGLEYSKLHYNMEKILKKIEKVLSKAVYEK